MCVCVGGWVVSFCRACEDLLLGSGKSPQEEFETAALNDSREIITRPIVSRLQTILEGSLEKGLSLL